MMVVSPGFCFRISSIRSSLINRSMTKPESRFVLRSVGFWPIDAQQHFLQIESRALVSVGYSSVLSVICRNRAARFRVISVPVFPNICARFAGHSPYASFLIPFAREFQGGSPVTHAKRLAEIDSAGIHPMVKSRELKAPVFAHTDTRNSLFTGELLKRLDVNAEVIQLLHLL